MMSEQNSTKYLLSSVKNALRILKSFTMDEPEKKVTDLAKELGISKSTVSRLMSTLASEGFVYKDPETQSYRLGLSVLALTGIVTSHLDIYKESNPVLRRLVTETKETAHIAVLENEGVVYLHKIECNHPVRILSHIGRWNPLHCTSSGKVLLAAQPEQVIHQLLFKEPLKKYTANTVIDPQALLEQLHKIKQAGYASSFEELLEGVVTVAAPIRDYTREVIAAVSITGPIQRVHHQNIDFFIRKVIQAGKEISVRLGYR